MKLMRHWKKLSIRKTLMKSTTNRKSINHLRYELFPCYLIDGDDDEDAEDEGDRGSGSIGINTTEIEQQLENH